MCKKSLKLEREEIIVSPEIIESHFVVQCPLFHNTTVSIDQCLNCPYFISIIRVRKGKIQPDKFGLYDIEL